MLRNALFSLLILIAGKGYAQQDFFVLIQADNSQPFYVKLGDKSLSSNIKGRLILSQLKGGSYNITVGFPKQLYPEQQFSFNIDEKDLEFQLKDLGEKGWGLFNPRTMELRTADKKEATANNHSEGIKKDDAFSRLMAGVVSDTAVMYHTYAMEEELKVDTLVTVSMPPALPRGDTTVTVPVPTTLSPANTVQITPPPRTTGPTGTVVKLSERKTPKGLRLAFADRPKGRKADTVILIIPLDSFPARQTVSNKPDSATAFIKQDSNRAPSTSGGALFRMKSDTGVALSSETIVRNNPDTIHVYISSAKKAPNREPFRGKTDSAQKGTGSKPMVVNSDCRNFALDYDVDKLRVKMLEFTRDEDRIQTARKIFKTKCFTTKQIKALSEVFTTDAGKYRFFEAAYPFVSDDRFRELTDLLADPVYNGKFKAMTGQQ